MVPLAGTVQPLGVFSAALIKSQLQEQKSVRIGRLDHVFRPLPAPYLSEQRSYISA